jgi:hypothetical protein
MRKLFLLLAVVGFFATASKAQLIDEQNVTVTMDLQPVLQLSMTTPDHIEFVFDDIREYYSGIVKYGATILKVSSSVTWDLYAAGTSMNGTSWDQQISYSAGANINSVSAIPLQALELHQYGANNYASSVAGEPIDYSSPFNTANYTTATTIAGTNSIFGTSTPYTAPGLGEKYIQGASGISAGVNAAGAPAGSYLTNGVAGSPFYYVIDYRILPGLPAVFPLAGTNNPLTSVALTGLQYAEPGVYTMDAKYVLLEDQ